MRTDRVIAMQVALQAFQLNSSSRNISWLTHLALSVAVTKQIEFSLHIHQTTLGLMWIPLSLFGIGKVEEWKAEVQSCPWEIFTWGASHHLESQEKNKSVYCPPSSFALLLQGLSPVGDPSFRACDLGIKTQRWAQRGPKGLPHLGYLLLWLP